MIIDLLDWDLTYYELLQWVSENDINLAAINGYGAGASTKYTFRDEEDFVAFRLKFAKERRIKMGYNSIACDDMGTYFAPYIPLNKDDA